MYSEQSESKKDGRAWEGEKERERKNEMIPVESSWINNNEVIDLIMKHTIGKWEREKERERWRASAHGK